MMFAFRSLIIVIPVILVTFYLPIGLAYAQSVQSNCVITKIGTPGKQMTIPAQCASSVGGKVPLYKQWDPRWASDFYGLSSCPTTIHAAGCGPTSLAMVISFITDRQVLPPEVANDASKSGWYQCGAGTAFAALTDLPVKYFGLQSKAVTWSQAKVYLGQGIPIIQSHGPGYFTGGGHYIVVTGVNSDGTYSINDPDGLHRTVATESEILDNLMGSWELSK